MIRPSLALAAELVAGQRSGYHHLDKRYLRRDGATLWTRQAMSLVRDENERPLHFVAQIQNVTEQHLAEARLRQSELQLRTMTDNAPTLIAYVDSQLRYQFVNKPYADWFALAPAAIVRRRLPDLLDAEHMDRIRPYLQRVLDGEAQHFDMELRDAAGELRVMHSNYVPDDSMVPARPGFHIMISDITGQTRLARLMEARALRDELTGLPNRMAWNETLRRPLAQPGRRGADQMAVMFLDLNDFKTVNDRFGHHVGAAVLVHFARLLKSCLREEHFIARLGGDEFVVLLDQLADALSEAQAAAARVLAAAHDGCVVDGQLLPL